MVGQGIHIRVLLLLDMIGASANFATDRKAELGASATRAAFARTNSVIVLLKFLMNKMLPRWTIKKTPRWASFLGSSRVATLSCLPFLAQSTPCRYLGVTGAEAVRATRH